MKTKIIYNTLSSLILVGLILNLTTGCFYYKVTTVTTPTPDDIRWEDFNRKYLILHDQDTAWQMYDVAVGNSELTCGIMPLTPEHMLYKRTDPEISNRFKKLQEDAVLKEVHLYTSGPVNIDSTRVTCHLSSISRMEVYNLDQGKTASSHLIPLIIIPFAIVGIILIVFALTKSSCPYVYVQSDQGYQFIGEIYSGSIYSSIERDDYLPLPGFKPKDNQYRVKISNELPEIQYIDLSELWVVDHPLNTGVLADKQGKLHTFRSPRLPVRACTAGDADITGILEEKDQEFFSFNEDTVATGSPDAINSVELTFEVPPDQAEGKLIVKAKNSYWGDYISGEFIKLFGNRYEEWVKKQSAADPDSIYEWRKDQYLPLMVYVQTCRGWEFVDFFHLTGPLAFREMVMPIDFTRYFSAGELNSTVNIRLETGFMFWELDYAALDISPDENKDLKVVPISTAMNESGKDKRKLLVSADGKYYVQPDIGNEVLLSFDAPPGDESLQRSLLLHARGYYNHVRYFKDPPDKESLVTFRNSGRLSEFSYDKFCEALSEARNR